MKKEKQREWDPKNKLAEPSEEQQLEDNHLDESEKDLVTVVEDEDEEDDTMDDAMEEEDDYQDIRDEINHQGPESNINIEQNRRFDVNEVKDLENMESNKITNLETEIVKQDEE